MKEARITVHPAFEIGRVDERIFGGFIEHLGRCIYEGIYDPDSSLADPQGIRKDVMDVLKPLKITAMRYPGGNFVSGYHWLDGVGPREQRPLRREIAWKSIESNQFGTDEFLQLCKRMNWEPMMAVNLGTGTPEEACNWLEYCNCGGETKYAKLRQENGRQEPYGVKLWCLGNEMDGSWQMGHVPARDYAIRAQQAAKLMKDLDGSVELVLCGSCAPVMPSYMQWDLEVMDYVGEYADYISLHRYIEKPTENTGDFLAFTHSIDRQIEDMDAACRYIQARKKTDKRYYLAFDEWNTWYREKNWDGRWQQAPPLLEEVYTFEDALAAAGFLNSFIRHADCVKIANLAQMVNVIAPVMTSKDGLFRQTIYYPLEMVSSRREGISLQTRISGPEYKSETYGLTGEIDASTILNGNRLNVFLLNRGESTIETRIQLCDRTISGLASGEILHHPNVLESNSFEEPDRITSRRFEEVLFNNGRAVAELPGFSFAALTFTLES